jgi:hypothetical protein
MLDPVAAPSLAENLVGLHAFARRGNPAAVSGSRFDRYEVARDLDLMRRAIIEACPNDALTAQVRVFRLLTDLCFKFVRSEEVTTRTLATRFHCLDLFKRLEQRVKCEAARKSALISLDFLELALEDERDRAPRRASAIADASLSGPELGAPAPAGGPAS